MWVQISFSLLVIYVGVCFYKAVDYVHKKEGLSSKEISKKKKRFLGIFAGWLLYTAGITFSGIIADFSLPPKMPLLIILPTFVSIAWFLKSDASDLYLKHIPKQYAYYYQGFRVPVELSIYGLYLMGIGPVHVTFAGYNYEIVGSMLIVLVGLGVYQFSVLPQVIAYVINYIGLALLAIIVAIFMICGFFPEFLGQSSPLISYDFFSVPYTYLASVLMPSAVFVHCFSIVQYHKFKDLF